MRDPRAPLPHTWQSLLSSGDRGPGPHEGRGGPAGSALDVGRAAWLACFGLVLYAPTNHFWFAFQERHVTAFKSRWYHAPMQPSLLLALPCLLRALVLPLALLRPLAPLCSLSPTVVLSLAL